MEGGCPVAHEGSSSKRSTQNNSPHKSTERLDNMRTISSIPRSKEDKDGAYWIYPSESMFFNAMRRKNHDPQAKDMATIVPIHNAVNERAWANICEWERPYYSKNNDASSDPKACTGPKLVSFSGDAKKYSPRARLYGLFGYEMPFDRHDWVVDRCGQEIEYVIDFYAGKSDGSGRPSFFIDARPKLTSLTGCYMRARRFLHLDS